jgi:hypothetical protein
LCQELPLYSKKTKIFHVIQISNNKKTEVDYLWSRSDAYAEKRIISTRGEICPK